MQGALVKEAFELAGDQRERLPLFLRAYGYAINLLMRVSGGMVTQTFSATPTFDFSFGNVFAITLTANITSSTISNPKTGLPLSLILKQDATGGRTWVPPANLKLAGGALVLTAGANKIDTVTAVWDGANWYEIGRAQNI